MKTLVFTAKRLLDILDELEGIDNGELFSCCMFKIIHCEMIKLSYRNLRHDGETISSGQNIFVEELALAGRQTQDKILAFCCSGQQRQVSSASDKENQVYSQTVE